MLCLGGIFPLQFYSPVASFPALCFSMPSCLRCCQVHHRCVHKENTPFLVLHHKHAVHNLSNCAAIRKGKIPGMALGSFMAMASGNTTSAPSSGIDTVTRRMQTCLALCRRSVCPASVAVSVLASSCIPPFFYVQCAARCPRDSTTVH
jgi:hypothetical protein